MKLPIEHVRISSKGKDILLRIKKRTGLEHWNEICRIALCVSFANQTIPPAQVQFDSAIEIDWKIFSGQFHSEISAMAKVRAVKDGISLADKDAFCQYFRSHLERGITSLSGIKSLAHLIEGLLPLDAKI